MNLKLKNLAFAGLIGLNLFRPGLIMDRDSTSTGEPKNTIRERVETKMQNLKDVKATLKDVKVTAVGTSSLTVDNGGTSLTVNITDKTELRRKFWGKSVLAEFSVSDTVNVIGKWADDTKTSVNAYLIRNESIQKRFGVFFGTIKSLTSGGFVMTTIHRDDQTVTIGSAKLINRREVPIVAADIKVGDRVRVRGMWDSANKTITEVKEIKNFSLPPLPSKETKPSHSPASSTMPTPTPAATATP